MNQRENHLSRFSFHRCPQPQKAVPIAAENQSPSPRKTTAHRRGKLRPIAAKNYSPSSWKTRAHRRGKLQLIATENYSLSHQPFNRSLSLKRT